MEILHEFSFLLFAIQPLFMHSLEYIILLILFYTHMPLKHTQEINKTVKNKTTQAEKKGLTVSLAAMAD